MRENFQFWQVAGILTDALISFQKLLKNNFLRLHFYDMHIIQKQHTVQNCILKKAILESSFEQKSERWPRKIVVWKRFCQSHNIEKSSETRNKQLLFVFTSSSSHPDSCQKTLVFFFKSPTFFPLEKETECCFAALSSPTIVTGREDSKAGKKVKMVLVVVAKMVPKMNRGGESYWHFFSLLFTEKSQKRSDTHSQSPTFFHQCHSRK